MGVALQHGWKCGVVAAGVGKSPPCSMRRNVAVFAAAAAAVAVGAAVAVADEKKVLRENHCNNKSKNRKSPFPLFPLFEFHKNRDMWKPDGPTNEMLRTWGGGRAREREGAARREGENNM